MDIKKETAEETLMAVQMVEEKIKAVTVAAVKKANKLPQRNLDRKLKGFTIFFMPVVFIV